MLHSLIVTLTPWLPTHTAPMDIVSVSPVVTPPKCVCLLSLIHTPTHTHTHCGWQGKCGDSHPIRHHCRASGRVDTNYSQPD